RADAQTALGELSDQRAAARDLKALIHNRSDWNADRSAARPAAVLGALRLQVGELHGASFAQEQAVIDVARDIAQSAIVAAGGPNATTSPLIADADNALLTGNPVKAVKLLSNAFDEA
ncbi:MAG TPA: hypothetical protein VIH49_08120, partial [Solirubrobacteraceae bacterium]